ncbi:MAG: hypothetical protein DDT21_01448 [Syntrophomonadaceae bacterium]|nr:hypothetical protein [Bacillota bacterium]
MQLFEVFPPNFFSLFASPNREIYAEALLVLHRHYRQETRLKKAELVSRLVAGMETRMLALEAEEGDPYGLGEDFNLSGRAHFLLRKFLGTGWLEVEADMSSFEECYIVPGYASKVLNLFYDILQGKTVEYNGYVHSTYSSLKTADQERGEQLYYALRHAHQATRQLWDSLRELLDNIRQYHQRLQQQVEAKELLVEHFDKFRVLVADKVYHPLKTFDSVPRYKQRIVGILKKWLREGEVLLEIARTSVKRGEHAELGAARERAVSHIVEVLDIYDKLDELLAQIDRKNAGYTRASVERLQYYLHTGHDIRGKLVEVLKSLPSLRRGGTALTQALSEGLPLYETGYLDEYSMFTQPKKREHLPEEAVLPQFTPEEIAAEMTEFMERLGRIYSHKKIVEFIMSKLDGKSSLTTCEIEVDGTEDFVKLLMAVVKSGEKELPYRVEFKDGYLYVNGYRLPELVLARETGAGYVGK